MTAPSTRARADGPARSTARSGAGPSLRLARSLMRTHGHLVVAGMDEVGRGALAGPVSVGVVAVTADTRSAPPGLDDSKQLTALQRERLAPRLQRWAPAWAVGHASNDEIDAWGILLALRVAGLRALAELGAAPDRVVLDGSYDWLRRPVPVPRQESLLDALDAPDAPDAAHPSGPAAPGPGEDADVASLQGPPVLDLPLPRLPSPEECLPVDLVVKADRRCAAVAAASVLAKVERDRIMTRLGEADPRWGWAGNKGYSAPEHLAALAQHGPCDLHRRSWRLPGRA